jgi:hypothetical protein
VYARLQADDERNRHAREAAASSILKKITSTSESAPSAEVDPVTAQLYELLSQLARLTRDLLPGVQEAKEIVL